MNSKAFYSLFWMIFYEIFQEKKSTTVRKMLSQSFASGYGLFFLNLSSYDKDKNLQLVPFILAHAFINLFYQMFPSSRLLFSRQFGLKIFRLCIYEIQGITVSTTYLELFIKTNFKDDILGWISIATEKKDDNESFLPEKIKIPDSKLIF